MQFTPGIRLGVYELIAPIASGGMGEVYRARDTILGREVAIKVLGEVAAADPERRRRFEQEARAVAALSHPNILAIYGYGSENGVAYAAMELLQGRTLRDELANGRLSVRRVVDLGTQMALGLAAAHDKGIIHRDLKPENVFVTTTGQVKLLDFGLAHTVTAPDESPDAIGAGASANANATTTAFTGPGVVLGTFGHMAPEQVSGSPPDRRSDVFSLGIVLYEMLTGRLPFWRDSAAGTLAATLGEDPVPIAELRPGVPPILERIVMRCLAKSPAERFQSTRDLAFALSAAGPQTSSGTVTIARRRRVAKYTVSAVITGVIAGVIGGLAADRLYPRASAPRAPLVTFAIDAPSGTTIADVPAKMLALSPDGSRLVFAVERNGHRELWIRMFDSPMAVPLPGTQDASEPFWSPDGQSIGFFAESRLKRVNADGSLLMDLCDAPLEARGGSWNAEGVILFGDVHGGLSRVRAGGGAPERVTMRDRPTAQAIDGWPQFLPGGRRFLFLRQQSAGTDAGAAAFLGTLDSHGVRSILAGIFNAAFVPPDRLLFVDATAVKTQMIDLERGAMTGDVDEVPIEVSRHLGRGALTVSTNGTLAYASAGSRESRIVWVDRRGRETGLVASGAGWRDIALSPDRTHLASQRITANANDIWIIDMTRGVPSRFTFSPDVDDDPVWSPDGRTLAFSSIHDGVPGIYQKSLDGAGGEKLLLTNGESVRPRTWSPDGHFLLYEQTDPATASDVWVLPLAGDRTPRPYLHTTFSEADPQFSPDGMWVAYSSDESGRNEIYLQPFAQPGAKVQISTDGGESPRWAIAGNALYFLSSERRLMSAPIQLRPLRIGAPVPLFDTSVGLGSNRYVPSRDGTHFLLSLGTARIDAAPLMVMLNWTTSLHREAAESRVLPGGIEGNPQEGNPRDGTGPPSSR